MYNRTIVLIVLDSHPASGLSLIMVLWLICNVWPRTHRSSRFIIPGWMAITKMSKSSAFSLFNLFILRVIMRYECTDDAKVEIILNTTDARFGTQIHVSRLEQWPKTLSKGKCENCTSVQVQDRWDLRLKAPPTTGPEWDAALKPTIMTRRSRTRVVAHRLYTSHTSVGVYSGWLWVPIWRHLHKMNFIKEIRVGLDRLETT